MIAKMKKLTFLIYHKEYESFLQDLREVGVVHIVERKSGEIEGQLQGFIQKRNSYKALLQNMLRYADQVDPKVEKSLSGDEIINRYESIQAMIQASQQRLVTVQKDLAQMKVWGQFDWARIRQLEEMGWLMNFYTCAERQFDESWEEAYHAITIHREGGRVYFVTVTKEPVELDAEKVVLPSMSLLQLEAEKSKIEAEIQEHMENLRQFCNATVSTCKYVAARLQEDLDMEQVKLNGERLAEGSVLLLEGWVPEENEQTVLDMLESRSIYYEVRSAEKEDNAPIKLKNNAFVRMYEVLTKMYGMPDYGEFDPTPILAPFFSLFFAFCMGDAGYGLILIALGFLLKKKMSKSMAGMMNLVITLGVFTTVFGAVLGTFFGVNLFDVELPQWMKGLMITGKIDGTNYDKQMLLALIIGVVHICLAMTVKAVCSTVRYGFKASLSAWGWLLLVVGFICTGGLSFFEVISAEVTNWAFIVIGGISAIGIYLLNDFHRNIFANIGAGVWDTYNMATGLLGDTLSYIRLYALGLAGGMLGGVFNQLAFMVNDAAGPVLGWIFCGLILVFGHALNIAMSCLSAFVHPLRLTFVEYFKNSGYEGKGEAYKPFSVMKSNNE